MFPVLAAALLCVVLLCVAVVRDSPALQATISALTATQIDSFNSYTWYASASYCTPAKTLAWNCGNNCAGNPDFKPVASGGNGSSVQYWFVGYDSRHSTVIVAHQGTNPKEIEPLITDGDFFLRELDHKHFPGVSSDIKVHNGFADGQASTATDVLAAVQQTMSQYGATSVTTVGHSLGAAIALLDTVYLRLWLPAGTTFKAIGYGLPRVGNKAFADYVDANLHLTHINNKDDPIPISPGMFLGFVHPSGEVHIEDSGEWAQCPGQDNPSTQCAVGDVPYIWDSDLGNHDGPYNGIKMGC